MEVLLHALITPSLQEGLRGSNWLENVNTKSTRGHCLPGQRACLRGATLTYGINPWGRSLCEQHWKAQSYWDIPVGLNNSTYTGEKRENNNVLLFFFSCRRDVFTCIGLPDGDPSWKRSFSRWPLGVCDYLVPVQRQFHPEKWAHRTRNLYNWSEAYNR